MLLLLLLAACRAPAPEPAVVFVRDGWITTAPGRGRPIGGDRWLVSEPWSPGETIGGATAPAQPSCVDLFRIDLGDVDRQIAAGGAMPDTAVAWSPDADRLAVGTARGEVLVVDGWTGEVLARRRLAEALVKRVAWSRDGAVVYAAEQSPDATVAALDASDLSTTWRVRLADRVGTSPLPPSDDLFGVYTLPGAYGLEVLEDGNLVVSAVHAWNPSDGVRNNLSQLLVLRPDGTVRAAWPASPASVTLLHPKVSGDRVAVQVGRSATGAPPPLPIGGVQILSLPDLAPGPVTRLEPLAPYYDDVFFWEATVLLDDRLVVGVADGRVVGEPLGDGLRWRRDLGTPVQRATVPVAAPIGHAVATATGVAVVVGGSNVPFGSAVAAAEPPAPHPEAHSLHVLDPTTGETRWLWRGPPGLSGASVSPDGDTLVVGMTRRDGEAPRPDRNGVLVFRAAGEGSGAERLRVACPAASAVFFRHAPTDDGRIAVVEVPERAPDGGVLGEYALVVVR